MSQGEAAHSWSWLVGRWTLLATTLFVVGTNAFIIPGVLPEISRSLAASRNAVEYGITLYAVVIAVAAPLISIVLPQWTRTGLLIVGLSVLGVGTLLSALAPDLSVFLIGRALAALGGAAVVPTATAAGAAIAPQHKRGQAIAFVSLGFSLTIAAGVPIGTAVGAAVGWRVPMMVLAIIAVVLIPAIATTIRRVPASDAIALADRFRVLRRPAVVLPLVATVLTVTGSNTVYLFSAATSGFAGLALAVLLLVYGVLGVLGNAGAGPLTDRLGSRRAGTVLMAVAASALIGVTLCNGHFVALFAIFALCGLSGQGIAVPVQHRLLGVDAGTATVAISWYTTALYLGLALAPVVGSGALASGGSRVPPLAGAAIIGLSLVVFQLSFLRKRAHDDRGPNVAVTRAFAQDR